MVKKTGSDSAIYRLLVEKTAGTVGVEFFHTLTRNLAEALDAEYAFVSEFRGDPPEIGHLISVYGREGFDAGYQYRVPNSPSQTLLTQKQHLVGEGIAEDYPEDTWLAQHNIESYAASVLIGPNGKPLGHIGLLDSRKHHFPQEILSVLGVMAERAAAEYARLEAERAMQWSEMKFATAFRASPSIITITRYRTGEFVDVSEAIKDWLGYAPGDLIGRTALEVGLWIDPDDHRLFTVGTESTERTKPREVSMRAKDGRIHTILISSDRIEIEQQQFLLSTLQDISTLRETQQHLEKTEQTYFALFNASNDYIFVYEAPAGNFIEVNAAALRRLGYSRDEILGMTTLDVLAEFTHSDAYMVRDLLSENGHALFETYLQTRSGELIPVESNSHAFELAGRQVVLSIARDLSERHAEEKARETQIAAMEASVDGIAILDGNLHYRYVNRAHQQLNQYSDKADIIGKSWHELTPKDQIEEMEANVIGEFQKNGYWRGEINAMRADGSIYPQELSLTRIDADNIICVIRDVTERHEQEQALRIAEEKYRQIFENAVEGIYRASSDGRLLDANPAFAQLLGFGNIKELFDGPAPRLTHFFVNPQVRGELMRELEERGAYRDVEYQLRRVDGVEIWVADNARMMRDEQGRVAYYEGIVQNISARKSAEAALAQSEEKYRTLVDSSHDGVYIVQRDSVAYINNALAEIIKMDRNAATGTPFLMLFHPDDREMVATELRSSSHSNLPVQFEARLVREPDNEVRFASITSTPIIYQNSPARTGTIRDITEQKLAEEQLLHNAFHDALTGLPNRTYFLGSLKKLMDSNRESEAPRRFAIIFMDLDRFKLINDSLGHAIGDSFLIAIADRLKRCLKEDDLLARHGGDEFTVLTHDIKSVKAVEKMADKLQRELEKPYQVSGHEVYTNASMGIVVSAAHYAKPEEMLRDADTAMYRAKAMGRAMHAVFDDAMHEAVKAHLRLETELRRALERDEFELDYQPIFNIQSRKTLGFEALLRWRHPDMGLLAPNEFLAISEESGLILDIGWWTMKRACLKLKEWQQLSGNDSLFVNVNIANRQFSNSGLIDKVREVLSTTRIAPDRLRLEITETVFMDNPDAAQEILDQLHKLGVKLQMDDFGTGFSSLSGLRNFTLDTLKIDRSFVQDITIDAGDLSIVRTIAQLARDLNMDVVAEGVETEEQLRLLEIIGCELAQGYLVSRPIPEADVPEWLLNHG